VGANTSYRRNYFTVFINLASGELEDTSFYFVNHPNLFNINFFVPRIKFNISKKHRQLPHIWLSTGHALITENRTLAIWRWFNKNGGNNEDVAS